MSLTFTTSFKYATLKVDYYNTNTYVDGSGILVSFQQKIATEKYTIALMENP
jgi:hypothetical protein